MEFNFIQSLNNMFVITVLKVINEKTASVSKKTLQKKALK